MSVQNHTYNINYPNMNFGQTILQGMFGSLTGCMGMNGSIFSSLGMGGCCGGFGGFGMTGFGGYTDQMIGMQIGSSIFNYGMMALGQYTQQRKAQKSTSEQITSVETQAETYLKTLNMTCSLKDFSVADARQSFNKTEYFNSNVSLKIQQKRTAIFSELEKAGYSSLHLTQADFKKTVEGQEVDDTEAYNNYVKIRDALQNQLDAINKINENTSSEALNSELVGADVIAAVKAMEAKEAAVNEAIDKLTELKETYDELKSQETDEMINDLDGWSGSRTRKSKLNEKLVTEEGNAKKKTWDKAKKATKDDIQGALAAYRKAKSPEEEQQWLSVLTNMAANKESETKGFEVLFERLGIAIAE